VRLATLRRRLVLSEALAALVLSEELLPLLPLWVEAVRAQHSDVLVSPDATSAYRRVMDHILMIAKGGHPSSQQVEFIQLVVREMRSIPREELAVIAQLPELPGAEEEDEMVALKKRHDHEMVSQ
jgi:hypothetical protein